MSGKKNHTPKLSNEDIKNIITDFENHKEELQAFKEINERIESGDIKSDELPDFMRLRQKISKLIIKSQHGKDRKKLQRSISRSKN
jgi:hypothetical protein